MLDNPLYLMWRDVGLIEFGINGNKNDVSRVFYPIDDSVSGALALLDITVLYSGLINRVSGPLDLVSNDLPGCNVIKERLNIGSDGSILFGEGSKVSFKLRSVFDSESCDGIIRHLCHPKDPIRGVCRRLRPLASLFENYPLPEQA